MRARIGQGRAEQGTGTNPWMHMGMSRVLVRIYCMLMEFCESNISYVRRNTYIYNIKNNLIQLFSE